MSKVIENRLTRIEKSIGLANSNIDVEEQDGDPVAGRAALLALLATRLGPDGAAARLAELEAEQRGAPRRRLSEVGRQALQALRATRRGDGAMQSVLPVSFDSRFAE